MGKRYILLWNNSKSQRFILHSPRCAFPETSINQVQEGLAKLYSMSVVFFKESDRVHACLAVTAPQQREEWTHQSRVDVVTDT